MGVVAIKTGLSFVAILGIFGVLQSQAVTESLLLFAAAGLIPGTNIELSPDTTLLIVGVVLLITAALVFRKYVFRHASVEAALSQYVQEETQESGETIRRKRVSYLRRLAFNVRLATYVGGDEARKLYFGLKSLGRQVLALFETVYKKLIIILLSFDYSHAKTSVRENLEALNSRLRYWTHNLAKNVNLRADKTLAYFVRLILR